MKRKIAMAIAALGLASAEGAHAQVISSNVGVQITGITTYSTFGNGDMAFEISVPIPGCEGGVWVRATDPGAQQSMAAVLSARMAGRAVTVYVDNSDIWTGAASNYCRYYGMTF